MYGIIIASYTDVINLVATTVITVGGVPDGVFCCMYLAHVYSRLVFVVRNAVQFTYLLRGIYVIIDDAHCY